MAGIDIVNSVQCTCKSPSESLFIPNGFQNRLDMLNLETMNIIRLPIGHPPIYT